MTDKKQKATSKIFSLQMSKTYEKSVVALAHLNACNIRQLGDKIVRHYIVNLSPEDRDLFMELYTRTHGSRDDVWETFFSPEEEK
jgi:ribosomal protein L35AE/L33A